MLVLNFVLASSVNGWSGDAPMTAEKVSGMFAVILKMLKTRFLAGVISQAARVESVVSYWPATCRVSRYWSTNVHEAHKAGMLSGVI